MSLYKIYRERHKKGLKLNLVLKEKHSSIMWKYFTIIILNINLIRLCLSSSSIEFKILYADDIFLFDFTHLDFSNQSANSTSFVSENLQTGSIICYIIIRGSNLNVSLDDYNQTFLLEFDQFGSSSLMNSISLYMIKLNKRLDREYKDMYLLNVKSNTELIFSLTINVNDTNDNQPVFEHTSYEFNIYENNEMNYCFGFLKANDSDLNENAIIRYYIQNNSLTGYRTNESRNKTLVHKIFYLNEITGELCAQQVLDREEYFKYEMKVIAKNKDMPEKFHSNDSILVRINIIDENDNKPEFYLNSTDFYLKENSQEKTFIAWLQAYDWDLGLNSEIEYSLLNQKELFSIDSKGIIRNLVKIALNEISNQTNSIYSTNKTNFALDIIAKDKGDPFQMNKISINIKIIGEKEQTQLNLNLTPNKTLFYIITDYESIYEKALLKVRASIENKSTTNTKYSYQLIPNQNGKNCSQDDVLSFFKLTKQGELFVSKALKHRNLFQTAVCQLTIKVLEQSRQLRNEINLTFQISNLYNSYTFKTDKHANKSLHEYNQLNMYLLLIYVVVVFFILFLFGYLLYHVEFCENRSNNSITNETKKEKESSLAKINLINLFKWFDKSNLFTLGESKLSSSINSFNNQKLINDNDFSNGYLKRTTRIFRNSSKKLNKVFTKTSFKVNLFYN